ncbi:MAG TPA: TIGR03668 family PPOX class F420-dependent oxidoreductase [Actinomycetes bacterium]|jgi:PPOX class probable F420-dependent enzyme|nr:TIGR03668 family PPOX class F420-dependent oxidoreductase [Actinomycetes bacterium]
MDERQMRRRVAEARVARVGTVDEHGRAHLVPIVFAVDGDTLYSATDAGSRPVKRLRNLQRDPRVTVLVDVYDEDWSKVWWVRMRGRGRVIEDGPERDHARRLLWGKYPQFGSAPPGEADGPVMAVDVEEWSGWAYSG